jgi:hypothetical protein
MTDKLTPAEAFAEAVATVKALHGECVVSGFTEENHAACTAAYHVAVDAFSRFATADDDGNDNAARTAVFEVEKELAEFPNHYRFEPKRLMFDEDITSGVNEHVLFSGIIASFATLYVIHRNRNIA